MSQTSRILIVDDEPFNVDYLEQELEDLGLYHGERQERARSLRPRHRSSA